MTISDNKAETENSTEEFKGLPMRELIGAPLQTDKYQVHHIRIGDLQIRGLTIGSEDITAIGTTDNRK